MTIPTAPRATFSDDELAKLLELMKGSDSVELKLTVPEADHRSTAAALGFDPLQAQIRQVFFFDTPDLTLDAGGIVVRARRMQGKADDSVVKLRPVVPSEVPARLRKLPDFRVEVDALPGGFVCSATMKGLPRVDVRTVVAGAQPIRKLFTKDQRAFYAAHAPAGLAIDDLSVLGPILVFKLRFTPPGLDRRLVAEVWIYPDGSRILELSTRATTADAFQAAAELRTYLVARGVDLSGEQQTKTRQALTYFAAAAAAAETPAPAPIVPRWEWRGFADRADTAAARLAELPLEQERQSDEVYLLSERSDASVKIRDGLMDVKQLEQVGDDGLEQWRPVLKAEFPIGAADAGAVLAALGFPETAPEQELYTFDELVSRLVAPRPELRAVDVHKRRRHFRLDGCMVELSEITAEGDTLRTVVAESEDPALVAATVRGLGLEPRPNVCLPRGLKALVGLGARRFAVIDVGTNSVKFHVGERRADGTWRTVVDRAEVTRLGEGLSDGGELRPEPIARTVEAIAGMVDEAGRDGAEAIAAVGTAGMRMAANAAALVDAAQERTGVQIEVIPGEEEARLAYAATRAGLEVPAGPLAVFDTGGGSSQFTFGDGTSIAEQFSVAVGAARFTESFGLDAAVSEEVVASALEAIAADLDRLDGRTRPAALVAMGGAVTNLAAVKHGLAEYDPEVVHGTVLDLAEIDRQIELYRALGADERREIPGLQPKRAEVILAGACIVRTIVAKLGCESATVSDRGLRHGLLVERFG